MKCRETKYWLYSFRPNSSWPVDVVGHLQDCPGCRQLQSQLKQIEQGVVKLTSVGIDPTAKAKLLDLIDQTPQKAMAQNPLAASKTPWVHVAAYLTGAAAMLLVGWLLGHNAEPIERIKTVEIEVVREKPVEVFRDRIVEVVREKTVPVPATGERDLITALVRHTARLVQNTSSGDRLDTLLDMTDDVRRHALVLLEQGPREALPITIELYTQLLRDGVMQQLAQAPAESRTMLAMTARTRLEKMEKFPSRTITLPKVVADQRVALLSTTRQMLDGIDHPENMPAVRATRKPARNEMIPPSAALVQFALAYSSESDAMVRADVCADYVKLLMPTMMLQLAENNSPQGAEMGQQFGDMIRLGVYRPIELATAKEQTPAIKEQADRILKAAAQTVADMEKHLENTPKDQRVGLERAVQASKKGKGWGKGWGKSK